MDKAPFSQVLKILLAQPELRSKVKSVSFNCRSTRYYKHSAVACDLSDDIEEAWGQLDYSNNNNNNNDYKRWALRLINCEQGYAGVVLSLLPNVVKLDIAYNNLQYLNFSAHELCLFSTLRGIAPQIAGLSKVQELTLAYKSLGFLSWGFSKVTNLTIRWINENDIPNVYGLSLIHI